MLTLLWDVSPVSSPVTVSSHRGEFNEAKLEAVSLTFASCRLCPLLQLCKWETKELIDKTDENFHIFSLFALLQMYRVLKNLESARASSHNRTSTNGCLMTTATFMADQVYILTLFQTSDLYNGYLSTTATPLQRSPLYNGHLSTTVTSLQRSPLYNGNLSTTATSLQR